MRIARVTLVAIMSLLLLLSGPARAGTDVCPEPNGAIASACFLGPQAPAPGYLDAADDVDLYRVDLPPDRMIVARVAPAEYELQLILADGKARAEVAETGPTERTLKVDGLAPGQYFIKVFSQSAVDPNQPYELSVSFPPALALAAPGATDGQPTVTSAYVPPPANQYALKLEELGPGFKETGREEPEGGRDFSVSYVADDARSFFGIPVSGSKVGLIVSSTRVFPYGSEAEVLQLYEARLKELREKHGAGIQPVVGWGSERAMTYSWRINTQGLGPSALWARGILLKHQNAGADTVITGWEQFTTWDRIAQLAKKVEDRILAAAK